jgi:hypothetical protein
MLMYVALFCSTILFWFNLTVIKIHAIPTMGGEFSKRTWNMGPNQSGWFFLHKPYDAAFTQMNSAFLPLLEDAPFKVRMQSEIKCNSIIKT